MFKSLTSSQTKKHFITLVGLYTAYVWFKGFANAVIVPHFYQQGLSFRQIMTGFVYYFVAAITFQFIFKNVKAKNHWHLSIILYFLAIILIININHISQYYLSNIFSGFALIGFFLPYNVAHFETTPKHRTGISSAIMFSIGPIIGLITPLLAGFLANVSYLYIWILSAIFGLLSFLLVNKQQRISFNYSIKKSISVIKPTRLFIFLQGVWEPLVWAIIPIYTLFFIQTPLKYGAFMAYLSFMGILANLFLGRLTDKLQKRSAFLYPLTLLMAFITFLFPLTTKTFLFWIIISGAIKFILPIFYNISTAFIIDAHSNLRDAIPGRELVLSTGRLTGVLITALSFYLESTPNYIFYFLGSIMIIYPAALYYRTKISKRYNYL